MIKFFVGAEAVSGSNIYIEKKDDIKHLSKVLRAKVGDKVCISDGGDWEYETEIADIGEACVTLRILDKQKPAREPRTRVTLYQGKPKAQKMETVIQKTVEMGVDCIVPVFMERTVVTDKGQFAKKLARWQKISDEAVKQCKRSRIPEVREPISFAEMAAELAGGQRADGGSRPASGYDMVICPYENEEGRSIKDALRLPHDAELCGSEPPRQDAQGGGGAPERIALIIGPEGGFADAEIARLAEPDIAAEIVTLGKTILRTETAGLAALAMIMYELEL